MALQRYNRVDGKVSSQLAIDDRGFALGDAVFETILVRKGEPVWLQEHLSRLHSACARLGLDFPDILRREIVSLLADCPVAEGVLRITLSRESAGRRGYAPASRVCRRYLQLVENCEPSRRHWDEGISAFLCRTRLPVQSDLAGIKHTNRLPHILARAERSNQAFPEGVMLTEAGELIEGISSNLFLVSDRVLYTPILKRAGVAGIVRKKIFDLAERKGIPVVVKRLGIPDLYDADELFFTNSLIGLWPASRLDCHQFASMDIGRILQRELQHIWYG